MTTHSLKAPQVTHIAVYRNSVGDVTRHQLFFMPFCRDEEAMTSASAARKPGDATVDMFDLGATWRVGGWKFMRELEDV